MKRLPLHETHQSLGAQFKQLLDWDVPAHYGSTREEHLAVRKSLGMADLSFRGRLLVTGVDRVKFLQGLLTNDVQKLTEGQGLYAAILDPKGRMLSDLKVYAVHDALLLDLDREVTDKTVEILNRYKMLSKAKLDDLTETTIHLAIYGPMASVLLEKQFGSNLPLASEFSCAFPPWREHQIRIIRSYATGEDGYELVGPRDEAALLWKELFESGQNLGIKPIGVEALESLRVETGIPRYGIDMDEHTFPPEAGLEEKAISYTKGCYIGQETIARIKTYGQVHRKLMGFILKEDSESARLPQHNDKIFKDGEELGFVTSSVYSPTLGHPIALGYLRRKSIQTDLQVMIKTGEDETQVAANVVDLPFYRRNPV
jgi:glycine cleavage system T protein